MFARLLEMTVKPQMKPELLKKMRDEVLPIFQKYNGFLEMIPLDVETEPSKLFAISLWRKKVDAEKYERENYGRIKAIYAPFLITDIVVRPCNVDETIKKMIAIAA